MMTGSEKLRGHRISASVAVVIALMLLLSVTSCRTTSKTAAVTSSVSTSSVQDSCGYIEKLDLDTLKIKADTNDLFVPISWILAEKSGMSDSTFTFSGIQQVLTTEVGRSKLSVILTPDGLKIRATCDSIEKLLINKTVEIYRLRASLAKSIVDSRIESTRKVTITRMPLWAILALIISIAINALFIYLKLKP